jgi:hypothetical protein
MREGGTLMDSVVRSVRSTASGTDVDLGNRVLRFGVLPDAVLARRCAGLALRMESVQILVLDDRVQCSVSAVWHRLPQQLTVPLAAALAFARDGVPTRVRGAA